MMSKISRSVPQPNQYQNLMRGRRATTHLAYWCGMGWAVAGLSLGGNYLMVSHIVGERQVRQDSVKLAAMMDLPAEEVRGAEVGKIQPAAGEPQWSQELLANPFKVNSK